MIRVLEGDLPGKSAIYRAERTAGAVSSVSETVVLRRFPKAESGVPQRTTKEQEPVVPEQVPGSLRKSDKSLLICTSLSMPWSMCDCSKEKIKTAPWSLGYSI